MHRDDSHLHRHADAHADADHEQRAAEERVRGREEGQQRTRAEQQHAEGVDEHGHELLQVGADEQVRPRGEEERAA